jgi:hypothetical protein
LAAAGKIRWPPKTPCLSCPASSHMMLAKTPAGPKEAVRTEAMRLLAPLGMIPAYGGL